MRRSLQDMVAVITGASSGIGKALAQELSARGAKLALAARRMDRLDSLNCELGGEHLCLQTDVGRSGDCQRLISTTLDRFGRIDTLVCNAGYGFARAFDAMTEADIAEIFHTNLFGTTECCRLAIPVMRAQAPRGGCRGQLMVVSSACARRGLPYFSTYAATKAAQLSLCEGLRIELKPYDIAVTSVHPVLTSTDFFDTAHHLSGMDPAALAQGSMQTPAVVARKMAAAIEKPVREVWPKPMSRLGLTISVAIPGVVDKVMNRIRANLERDHKLRDAVPQDAAPVQEVSS